MTWNELQDNLADVLAQLGVCLCGGVPNFGPGTPKKGQNGPKPAKNYQYMTLSTLASWWSQTIGMAWNELQDILVEVLTQLGVCLCGGCPKFWPKRPKRAKIVQKWPKMTKI